MNVKLELLYSPFAKALLSEAEGLRANGFDWTVFWPDCLIARLDPKTHSIN